MSDHRCPSPWTTPAYGRGGCTCRSRCCRWSSVSRRTCSPWHPQCITHRLIQGSCGGDSDGSSVAVGVAPAALLLQTEISLVQSITKNLSWQWTMDPTENSSFVRLYMSRSMQRIYNMTCFSLKFLLYIVVDLFGVSFITAPSVLQLWWNSYGRLLIVCLLLPPSHWVCRSGIGIVRGARFSNDKLNGTEGVYDKNFSFSGASMTELLI